MRAPGPGRAGSPERASDSGHSPGQQIGLVLKLEDDLLKRVKGILVTFEKGDAVIAIPAGLAVSEEVPLEPYTVKCGKDRAVEVNYIRAPLADTTTNFVGWSTKVPALANDIVRDVLRVFYTSALEPAETATESMFSVTDQEMSKEKSRLEAQLRARDDEMAQLRAQLASRRSGRTAASSASWTPGQMNSVVRRAAGPDLDDGDDEDDEDDYEANAQEEKLLRELGRGLEQEWTARPRASPKEQASAGLEWARAFGLGDDSDNEYVKITQRLRGDPPTTTTRRPDDSTTTARRMLEEHLRGKGAKDVGEMTQAMMLMLLMQQNKKNEAEEDQGDAGGRAFKRIHKLKGKVEKDPIPLITEYLKEVQSVLGVEDGDPWQVYQMTEHVPWGKMLGLKRCHWHLSHALAFSLRGRKHQAEAYMVQLLKSLHQVALDGGSWEVASLLLPARDPCQREQWGASERELEAVASYRKAMKEIGRSSWTSPWVPSAPGDPAAKGGGKGKEKGKDKNKEKDGKAKGDATEGS